MNYIYIIYVIVKVKYHNVIYVAIISSAGKIICDKQSSYRFLDYVNMVMSASHSMVFISALFVLNAFEIVVLMCLMLYITIVITNKNKKIKTIKCFKKIIRQDAPSL